MYVANFRQHGWAWCPGMEIAGQREAVDAVCPNKAVELVMRSLRFRFDYFCVQKCEMPAGGQRVW